MAVETLFDDHVELIADWLSAARTIDEVKGLLASARTHMDIQGQQEALAKESRIEELIHEAAALICESGIELNE